MKTKYSFKKLLVLNIWFITACVLFSFAFMMVYLGMKGLHDAIILSSLALIVLTVSDFINLLWLVLYNNQVADYSPKSKRVYYVLSYSSTSLVFLTVVVCYNLLTGEPTDLINIISVLVISLFVNSFIVAFQNYTILQDAKVNADIENSQLKTANAEAANQLLRQQIHPHFLFNALSILKSLYKIDPRGGEEYLICLSDFLRASISYNNIKVVKLKDELKLCQDYLQMQKIRFANALVCSIALDEHTLESGFVPSFSIQPLLENAIKHNELTEEHPLHISIKQEHDRIVVTNNIKLKNSSEPSTGSGLANLSERYRILSHDALLIKNDDNVFSVSLKILDHRSSL